MMAASDSKRIADGDQRFFYAREGAYRKNILGFLILLESTGAKAQ